jgi:hypothetical protein
MVAHLSVYKAQGSISSTRKKKKSYNFFGLQFVYKTVTSFASEEKKLFLFTYIPVFKIEMILLNFILLRYC